MFSTILLLLARNTVNQPVLVRNCAQRTYNYCAVIFGKDLHDMEGASHGTGWTVTC